MEEESVLEISIPGARNVGNKYTEYEVVCITNSKDFNRCYAKVFRRYSDFHRLHTRLKCFMHVLPEFPKKRWNKLDKRVVEERTQMLTVYLRFVCDYILKGKRDAGKVSHDVMKFIQDSHV